MELGGIAIAAVGHHSTFAGMMAGAGGEQFGGVGLEAARFAAVVEFGRLKGHQIGRLQLGPAFGERMLDGLVLADRTAEDNALAGVSCGPRKRRATDADCLGRHQNALGI